jgi:orotate phosphoribosyltransferase-like protein
MSAGRKPILSPQQMAEAAQLYREGWSDFQLSDRFNVSRDTIQRAIASQGVQKRQPQEGRDAARKSSWRTWRKERRSASTELSNSLTQWSAK